MKINVLGTEYTVLKLSENEDEFLKNVDGYCDKTSKKIVVANKSKDNELEDFNRYQRKNLRHEIIHAFMIESGLAEDWEHKSFGQEETTVDWFAYQFPKIKKAFEEAGCLD